VASPSRQTTVVRRLSFGLNTGRFARGKKATVTMLAVPELNCLMILKAISLGQMNTALKAKGEKI